MNLETIIEQAWQDRNLLKNKDIVKYIEIVIAALDKGELRVAKPHGADWQVQEWIKKSSYTLFSNSKNENY